ncbi:MAG: DUF1631 family protein [Rudaea sp.]
MTLASRGDLSPRVRQLLEGILAICSSGLERTIVATLDDLEAQLFRLAEQSRNNDQQYRNFETLREIKRGRADVAPRYMMAIEDCLARFDQPRAKDVDQPRTRPGGPVKQELSLVDSRDLEESLALQEFAAKTDIRQAQTLYALGHRFAVLAGAPIFDAETLPIGPTNLGNALRSASEELDIPVEQRVLLYRVFDRTGQAAITTLYDDINAYFIEQRVLRHLRVQSPRTKPAEKEQAATAPTEKEKEQTAQADEPQHPQRSGGQNFGSARMPAQPGSSMQGAQMGPGSGAMMGNASAGRGGPMQGYPGDGHATQNSPGGFAAQEGSRQGSPSMPGSAPARGPNPFLPSAAPGAEQPSAPADARARAPSGMRNMQVPEWATEQPQQTAPADERDSELFTTLRELLAGRRHALGVGSAPVAGGYQPTGEDMQSVLGALQSKPISPIMMNGKLTQRSVAHLKQDLVGQLRQISPDGKAPQLAAEDSDTIDLVGMLFDYMAKNTRPEGSTQSLLTKLQVPLLRVALRDKSFFTRRAHPARQLLNAIAETGTHWVDDSEGPADRQLVDKMQIVVDRVTQEFDGNLNIMENMLGDLSTHMHTLARKAEAAERRHVDAAKGREKLEVAREQARSAIAERVNTSKPGKLVRTLLEQAWTDVLALTLLRQGESSDIYKKRLSVAEQLLAADKGGRAGEPESKLSPALRSEIETGLDQVGYHKEDIQAVVKRLFLPDEAANEEDPSTSTEIAIKLKSKQRFGDDTANTSTSTSTTTPASAAAAAAKPEKRAPLTPGSPEAIMFDRLRTLPFGSWFEFKTNQQGDTVRRKLAWFSTVTGRCLFVNQRGVRTDEKTMEQLARDVVLGQAAIVESEQETLVDRAWKAIVSGLKNLVGGDPAAVPAPA